MDIPDVEIYFIVFRKSIFATWGATRKYILNTVN